MATVIPVLPLVIPLLGLSGVLAAWRSPTLQAWIVLATGVAALGAALALWGLSGTLVYAVGGHAPPFGIALRIDVLGRIMLSLAAVVFTAAALYNVGLAHEGSDPAYHATFPLMLLALDGLFATGDVFNFYVCFELAAVASMLLVLAGRHAPLEASWKYATQSMLGSLALLVGVVALYGETGALAMAELTSRLAGPATWAAPFLLVAFLLKAALVPFHFWQPDAHAAATAAGSALLAGLLIKVGLFGLLRFGPLVLDATTAPLLVALGAIAVVFGAVAALRQEDAKRLLGFSSISQLGFVLVALGWGTPGAIAAAIFLICSHAIAKALLFLATGLLAEPRGTTRLDELAGTGQGDRVAAIGYLVGMFSLAGVPPAFGFVGKLGLLDAGLAAGAWGGVAWLAMGSLLTLAYATRAFQRLCWGPAPAPGPLAPAPCRLAVAGLAAVVGLGALGGAGPLWDACLASAAELAADRPSAGPRP